MNHEIVTHADVLRHTAVRVAVAVCLTVVLTLLMITIAFGTNPGTNIRLDNAVSYGVAIGAIIAAVLAGGLSYRSGLLMQELSLARAELLLISRTDQLTGLLNRRGYNEAALKALTKSLRRQDPSRRAHVRHRSLQGDQ